MDVCEDASSPPRNLEEARRDEGVSSSWEDELSKTLNMEPLGAGGRYRASHLGGSSHCHLSIRWTLEHVELLGA